MTDIDEAKLTDQQLLEALREQLQEEQNRNQTQADSIMECEAELTALRKRYESLKTKMAWHRDGVGRDVPVLQERYDRLRTERDDLREQLAQAQARIEKLDAIVSAYENNDEEALESLTLE